MILNSGSELRAEIRLACKRDFLFFLNAACWIFEPRTAREHPFISYPFQDELTAAILRAVREGRDLVIPKSRDMGATWCVVACLTWLWQFHGRQLFLFLSRTAELVDSGDQKSLFWKASYLLKNQPGWLLPAYSRPDMHLQNMETGASIDGDSSNKFAGVAARYRAVYLDEFSKMQNQASINKGLRDVTDCRIYSFTPEGSHNTAAELMGNPHFDKFEVHWTLHPDKRKGLYRVPEDGKVELLDKEFWTDDGRSRRTLKRYKFVRTAPKNPRFKYRSPWYDKQCRRAVNEVEIATELDIDTRGSEFQFFNPTEIEKYEKEVCRLPLATGRLAIDPTSLEALEFVPDPQGSWEFWIPMADGLRPAADRTYVIGIDLSFGTGASNSVLAVVDCKTKEKVAQFVSARTPPLEMVGIAIGAGKWFGGPNRRGAFLAWEVNGPGVAFGRAVRDFGYGNFYMQRSEDTLSQRQSESPGWQAGGRRGQAKTALFEEYRAMLYARQYINRSFKAVRECHQMIYTDKGGVGHAATENSDDPTQATTAHGDMVSADALACVLGLGGYRMRRAVAQSQMTEESEDSREATVRRGLCMAARDLEAELSLAERDEEW